MKTLFALASSCAACTSLLVFLARPCPAYAQDAKPAASPPPQNQAESSSSTRKLEQYNIDLSKGEVAKQAQPSATATAPATQRAESALPNATPVGDTVPQRAAAPQSDAASADQRLTPTSQLSGGSDTFVATATKKGVESPTPFLIGNYEHGYYRLDACLSRELERRRKLEEVSPFECLTDRRAARDRGVILRAGFDSQVLTHPEVVALAPLLMAGVNPGAPLRFYAARFKLALGADDLKDGKAYNRFQTRAEEAGRVVAWNNTSLGPRAVVNQAQYDLNDWVIVGVFCPRCDEHHWLAYGYNGNDAKFEIFSNSPTGQSSHPPERGWETRKSYRAVREFPGVIPKPDIWVAPVDEGGWLVESFVNRRTGMPCGIRLQLGLARRVANVVFGFQGPKIAVGLTDGHGRLADELEPTLKDSPPASEPIHFYAIIASVLANTQEVGLRNQFFANVVCSGEAAALGREVASAEGLTLKQHASLKRQRLTDGKVLILGVYNASRDENQWLVIRRTDRHPGLEITKSSGYCWPEPASPNDGTCYKVSTGGFDVVVRIAQDPDNPDGVEYLFQAPE
jgi:hypothetical protein